jgi:hypothetical protein
MVYVLCIPGAKYLRAEGKTVRERGCKTLHALSLPLPPHSPASWTATCVFVTVNEARRYLATSINKMSPLLLFVQLYHRPTLWLVRNVIVH